MKIEVAFPFAKKYVHTLNVICQFIYQSIDYLQRDKIWRYVISLYKVKDRKGREKEEKDWTEHGAEDRRVDVNGELVRGLLGTSLALGRVITRFVSRKPPGSTQMRTVTENTMPSYSSQFLRQPDDSFSLAFSLSTALSLVVIRFVPFRAITAKQRPFHFLSLYSNVNSPCIIY